MWDFVTLREIVDSVPVNTALQNKALFTANKIMNAFKSGDPDNVNRMRGIAEDVFGKGWQAKGDKIYNEGPKKAQIVGISYCHIVSHYLQMQVMTIFLMCCASIGYSMVMAVFSHSAEDSKVLVHPD